MKRPCEIACARTCPRTSQGCNHEATRHHRDERSSLPKASWGEGPWQNEPDRVEWRYGDVPCLLVRNRWARGAVTQGSTPGIPPTAKLPRRRGDPTHSGSRTPTSAPPHCHVPRAAGRPSRLRIGFDCGHLHDLSPACAQRSARPKRLRAGTPCRMIGASIAIRLCDGRNGRLARQLHSGGAP